MLLKGSTAIDGLSGSVMVDDNAGSGVSGVREDTNQPPTPMTAKAATTAEIFMARRYLTRNATRVIGFSPIRIL